MKTPQLVAFQVCRRATIDQIGKERVYDYLPPEGVAYPFFYIGEMQSVDRATKTAQIPTIYQTIHYYSSDFKKRGQATRDLVGVMERLREIDEYDKFKVDCRSISLQMINDNSTATPLLHGVLDVELLIL